MKVEIFHPSQAKVTGTAHELLELHKQLSYINESILFQKKRISENYYWKKTNPVTHAAALREISEKAKGYLMYDSDGGSWNSDLAGTGVAFIRPGSVPYLGLKATNTIEYPKPKGFKMVNPFPFELYGYQKEAIENMIEAKHASVSIATGLGKTAIIASLCAHYGLKTVVMTPFSSIFNQILEEFKHYFGKNMVSGYGDGKKDTSAPIVVSVAKSITMIKENTKEWEDVANAQVLIVDESHTTGAETLEKACMGILKDIPYRFFLSGTQVRNDGKQKVLDSIIGRVVKEVSTEEGIKGGYICSHSFKIIPVLSSNPNYISNDPLMEMRSHFLYNHNIAQWAARIAQAAWEKKGQSTLILISELEQLKIIKDYLKIPFTYATTASAKEMEKLGLEKKKPLKAVEEFDNGDVPVLIGTSCIGTGVNIYSAHLTINWQGSGSEITTRQSAVGRSIRLLEKSKFKDKHPPKDHVYIFDFDVLGNNILRNQLKKRIGYYNLSGTKIEYIESQGKSDAKRST